MSGKGSDRKEFSGTLFLRRNSVLDVILARMVSFIFIYIYLHELRLTEVVFVDSLMKEREYSRGIGALG